MDWNEPECVFDGKLKTTPTVTECSPSTGPTSSDTETLGPSTGALFPEWICSAEDSHARTLALPEKEPGSQANVVASGSSTPKRSTPSSRVTSSSKMLRPFALADWIKFSGRSLRSGMMRSGTCYPLVNSALHTHENACSLWPTPRARDWKGIAHWPYEHGRRSVPCVIRQREGPGPPNPALSEWLMGYPIGWTDLED